MAADGVHAPMRSAGGTATHQRLSANGVAHATQLPAAAAGPPPRDGGSPPWETPHRGPPTPQGPRHWPPLSRPAAPTSSASARGLTFLQAAVSPPAASVRPPTSGEHPPPVVLNHGGRGHQGGEASQDNVRLHSNANARSADDKQRAGPQQARGVAPPPPPAPLPGPPQRPSRKKRNKLSGSAAAPLEIGGRTRRQLLADCAHYENNYGPDSSQAQGARDQLADFDRQAQALLHPAERRHRLFEEERRRRRLFTQAETHLADSHARKQELLGLLAACEEKILSRQRDVDNARAHWDEAAADLAAATAASAGMPTGDSPADPTQIEARAIRSLTETLGQFGCPVSVELRELAGRVGAAAEGSSAPDAAAPAPPQGPTEHSRVGGAQGEPGGVCPPEGRPGSPPIVVDSAMSPRRTPRASDCGRHHTCPWLDAEEASTMVPKPRSRTPRGEPHGAAPEGERGRSPPTSAKPRHRCRGKTPARAASDHHTRGKR